MSSPVVSSLLLLANMLQRYMYLCTYIYMYVCTYIDSHRYMYVCLYMCVYIRVCKYTYICTHTHTCLDLFSSRNRIGGSRVKNTCNSDIYDSLLSCPHHVVLLFCASARINRIGCLTFGILPI